MQLSGGSAPAWKLLPKYLLSISDTAELQTGRVCKQGATTGKTFGYVSADHFVLLNQEQHGGRPSLDWIVTNRVGQVHFSVGGDSGAWLYDTQGSLVGLVVGQATGLRKTRASGTIHPADSEFEGWHYITPIGAVFRDIERVTGCQVTVNLDSEADHRH